MEKIEEVERITPTQVATKLNMSVEGVRAALRQDKFPFRNSISREYRSMELYNYKK